MAIQEAVTARRPAGQLPVQELASWLGLRERLETRAELSGADPL
jgi:hypothetical protein